MIEIPHFQVPFRYMNGAPACNEQDSPEDVAAAVEAVLRYPYGFRLEAPTFGISDQTFRQGGANVAEISAAIEEWEPRADAAVSSLGPDMDVDVAIETVKIILGGNG